MTVQERLQIDAYLMLVREQKEVIVKVEDVNAQVFRNLYHVTKNIELDVDVEIMEPRKTIRIFKKDI